MFRYVCVLYGAAAAVADVTVCNIDFVSYRTVRMHEYVCEYIKYVYVGVVQSVSQQTAFFELLNFWESSAGVEHSHFCIHNSERHQLYNKPSSPFTIGDSPPSHHQHHHRHHHHHHQLYHKMNCTSGLCKWQIKWLLIKLSYVNFCRQFYFGTWANVCVSVNVYLRLHTFFGSIWFLWPSHQPASIKSIRTPVSVTWLQ